MGGGRIFEGGVLVGHYGIVCISFVILENLRWIKNPALQMETAALSLTIFVSL